MRIGIEAQRIFRRTKHGMDIVAMELIRNLQQLDRENEYFIFVRPDEDREVIKETRNFKIIQLSSNSYPSWEQYALPKAAKDYQCEILHCTSNTAPIYTDIPLVLTLHDIIYMENSYTKMIFGKGSNYQKFGNVYRRMIIPGVIRKAKKIITVSEYEKDVIAAYFNMTKDSRLTSVYNGVSEHFKPVSDKAQLDLVKTKYGLPEKFFFFLGNTHPKKNTPGTLKAFADFITATGSDIKLVMIDFDKNSLDIVLKDIGAPWLINHIVFTGYINNADLPAIYSQCEAFLYTSLRESFGIPIIEAMACGTPVITSNTSSMPEIAGNAAILTDPYTTNSITDAMIRIYNSKSLKNELRQKGLAQSAKFSWNLMAQKVLQTYTSLYQELN